MTQRQLLTDRIMTLLTEHHLLSAPQISQYLAAHRTYNKTSIYRALEKLSQEDKICKHNFGENETSYELREHHHAHLVCNSCGTVTTAQCSVKDTPVVAGFKTDHHHLTLFGTCKTCQKGR